MSRATGVPVQDITLFIFGGAAHIAKERRRARDEALAAVAGPVASLALVAGFRLLNNPQRRFSPSSAETQERLAYYDWG